MTDGCAICGQHLRADLVKCGKCGNRVHLRCWQFNNERCAVYACEPATNPRRNDIEVLVWIGAGFLVMAASMLVWIWRILSD